ncbi:MAG: GNAT family N-acetyltransferase [Pseudolysinimonas sp.]
MSIEIREVAWDHPDAIALREAQRVEVREVFYPELEDSEPGPHPSASDMTVFYVAYDDDLAVGAGGLRAIDDEHGEIKRMYVDPTHRGSGVAANIVSALEADARSRGWNRVVLETGDRMLGAQLFYQRQGYRPIEPFGPYVGSDLSRCFEKRLGSETGV